MSRAVLLAGLLAALSAAGPDHAAPGFQYMGCVRADPAAFPLRPGGLARPFPPDKCQEACGPDAAYAALGNGRCHCGDPASGEEARWDAVDEAECSTLCDEGDEDGGRCGGPGKDGKGVFNLYMKFPAHPMSPPEDEDRDEGKDTEPTRPPVETKMARPAKTVLETTTSCPPEAPDCPANKKPECPPEGCSEPPLPPPPTYAPRQHPKHANCTHMHPPPPVYTKLPADCTHEKPPHQDCPPKPPPECSGDCAGKPPGPPTEAPVVVSEASAQPWNRVMALLGLSAVVLAVGLS